VIAAMVRVQAWAYGVVAVCIVLVSAVQWALHLWERRRER
jgi:hypothetical protein